MLFPNSDNAGWIDDEGPRAASALGCKRLAQEPPPPPSTKSPTPSNSSSPSASAGLWTHIPPASLRTPRKKASPHPPTGAWSLAPSTTCLLRRSPRQPRPPHPPKRPPYRLPHRLPHRWTRSQSAPNASRSLGQPRRASGRAPCRCHLRRTPRPPTATAISDTMTAATAGRARPRASRAAGPASLATTRSARLSARAAWARSSSRTTTSRAKRCVSSSSHVPVGHLLFYLACEGHHDVPVYDICSSASPSFPVLWAVSR